MENEWFVVGVASEGNTVEVRIRAIRVSKEKRNDDEV